MAQLESRVKFVAFVARLNAKRSTFVRKTVDKPLRGFRQFPSTLSTMGAKPPYPPRSLRVSKENMFSGLNHITVHSILSPQYATSFGFTEKEVAEIIDPAHLQDVRAWYDGYNFGGHVIYNPWSILNYIVQGVFKPYWVNTGSSQLIEQLATKRGLGLSEYRRTRYHIRPRCTPRSHVRITRRT